MDKNHMGGIGQTKASTGHLVCWKVNCALNLISKLFSIGQTKEYWRKSFEWELPKSDRETESCDLPSLVPAINHASLLTIVDLDMLQE